MRRAALLLLASLCGCGAEVEATSDPATSVRALARVQPDAAMALAGDAELFTRVHGRVLEVRRVAPTGVLYRYEAPEGAVPAARLSASAERAGLIVTTEDDTSYLASVQELIDWEPLGAPFKPSREAFFPAFHQIEGARVITDEFRGDFRAVRWIVREPGAEARTVELLREAIVADFAGDLVAYLVPVPGQRDDDEPQRLVVGDWRTGQQRFTARIRDGIEDFDLRPDGRVVLNQDGGGLHEVAPGGAVERLSRTGIAPRWAGDRIVFLRQGEYGEAEQLMVVEPGGRVRRFGVPTAEVKGFVTDDDRVLWRAHGCLLVASVTAPAAREPGPGPCPRSELYLDDRHYAALGPDRRVPLTLRCIAAAPAGCVGSVRVKLADGPGGTERLRFRIPAGRSKRLAPRLTRRAHRAALRQDRAGIGGVALGVEAVAVDPDGRRTVLSDGYSVEVARR